MRILVTRPAHLATALCEHIRTLGCTPELLPLFEFTATPKQQILKEVISRLPRIDKAIFISRAAAEYGMKAIQDHFDKLPTLEWAAVGSGTAEILKRQVPAVVFPAHPPFDSEALLQLPAFQNVTGKTIVIFRGQTGRDLLADTLRERGAKVEVVETYLRRLPKIDIHERLNMWRENPLSAIIITSTLALNSLITLLGPENLHWLKRLPIIVVGERMQNLARNLGMTKVILSLGAGDRELKMALQKLLKETIL